MNNELENCEFDEKICRWAQKVVNSMKRYAYGHRNLKFFCTLLANFVCDNKNSDHMNKPKI